MRWQDELETIARQRAEVEIRLVPHDYGFRDCRISLIRTQADCRGQGLASAALRELCDVADKHEVWLHLTPDPVRFVRGRLKVSQGEILSKWALVSWYKRHGFARNTDLRITDTMSRKPRGQS